MMIRRQNRQIFAVDTIAHPIPVFTVGVLALAGFQGGVGYIPYLSDEFSHWVGITRQIHTLGAFDIDAIAHGVPDYLVGWPLLMAYPGAIVGTYDEGQIALLPTVLHIGMLAMVFDVVRAVLRTDTKLSEKQVILFTWLGLLTLLGIEASGQLVARNLLTEPPQVYGITAIVVLCMAACRFPDHALHLAGHAGIVLASLYIIKITALVMIPALAIFAVWLFRRDVNNAALLRLGLAYFGLMALALISWKYFGGPTDTTEYSNPARLLTPSRLANLASPESVHIAKLWFAHLWDYLSAYKAPLTLAALAGIIWAGFDNRWRWVVIVLGLFLLVYMAAFLLYRVESWKLWFHSVQRFTRVGLRAMHLIGLVLFGLMTLEALSRQSDGGFQALLVSSRTRTIVLAGVIALSLFQGFQGHRRIADLGTRAVQSTQEGTLTTRAGALALRSHLNAFDGSKPKILMINASHDRYWMEMLFLYLLPSEFAAGFPDVAITDNLISWYMPKARTVTPRQSPGWFPVPADIDIIWPLSLSATDRKNLYRVTDGECTGDPAHYFLVRQHRGAATFSCRWKLPDGVDGVPALR